MPPPKSDDQRTSPRAKLSLRVDYQRMNAFFADYTRNISKGGTFIKTRTPLAVGTRCSFAITVPALPEPIRLDGEVAWVLTTDQAKEKGEEPGMGIRFLFEGDGARQKFEELVERLMAESLGQDVAKGLLGKR